MANYKPLATQVNASAVLSGTSVNQDVSFTAWGLALLFGTALDLSGNPMASAGVQIWESTNPTTNAPDHTTFGDAAGKYGVTVSANKALVIKAYAQ